jgi:HAE1 family hydrophobic/amphiphilic exporter-1
MTLSDVSIRHPVFAVMLIGGLVVLGLVSIPRLGVDLWPRIEFPLITVRTTLQGAAPETMEREVTEVLEEAVNTIEGIRSLRSASSDSLSFIFIEFELEYDVQDKAQEVRERVAAMRAELPADTDPPVIDRVDPDAQPVLAVLLAGPYSIREVSEFADKRIKSRLERVPGVGSITLVGSRPREIRVWIDPMRLAGYGLGVDDVLLAMRREHVELPAGRIDTPRTEYALRTEGKLRGAEEFAAVVLAERSGRVIHLRDVATVEDGLAEERTISRLDGRRGVSLLVRRQSGENTVRVVDAVRRELEQLRPDLPPGYELVVALDASRFIRSAVWDVAVALAWGGLLAALVVLLFLRNMRSTLIAGVAIPTSVLASFGFFYAFGFTINTMTLMALALSIGLLIDDAIVVLESVYRHMERGVPARRAASEGSAEVALAVIATTLAVCAVFVPIAFLSGVVGRFFREFGIVASCAVALSTLVALTLTPMLCARFVRLEATHGRAYHWLEARYRALEQAYRAALRWSLAHRPSVIALGVVAVAGGAWLAGSVPRNFVAPEDRGEFNVWIKLPLGSPLAQTERATEQVEALLRAIPEVRTVFSTIGSGVYQRPNEATLFVQLVEKRRRGSTQQAVMDRIREAIGAASLPLEEHAVEDLGIIQVTGSRNSEIMYSVRGPDVGRLQYFTSSLVERMREAGGYRDVIVSYEVGKPEIALEISRQRAADLGVPAAQIASTISALFAGVKATTFEEGGERYDVRVQLRPEDRDDLQKLDLVRVRGSGGLVPLRNLVTPRIGSGPVQVDRENRSRVINVNANLAGKPASVADAEMTRFARELDISGEYEFQPIGPSQRLRETTQAIRFAFLLALIAIYMILAAQFDSFLHPFTIMLSAPLSFIGAFLALRLSGEILDVLGQISFLMLMGIVMKNGILLVDYTNKLRERGLGLHEAVLEAGPTRMRPVLMTAVSTVVGMLPLVVGIGEGSEWRRPMGIIAIGGLTTSTLLTLVVVPVVYTLVDDVQVALGGAMRARSARRSAVGR